MHATRILWMCAALGLAGCGAGLTIKDPTLTGTGDPTDPGTGGTTSGGTPSGTTSSWSTSGTTTGGGTATGGFSTTWGTGTGTATGSWSTSTGGWSTSFGGWSTSGWGWSSGGWSTSGGTVTVPPPPGCAEDANEPNEDIGSALPALWSTPGLAVTDLSEDFWSFTVADGAQVTVDALFVDAWGDIDLELLDSGGTILSGSYSVTDNETVSATNTSGAQQTWFVRVYLYAGTCNTYELVLTP